jgi:hypothetical protein
MKHNRQYQKNVSRQQELRELKQELQDRGFDERQIDSVLKRREQLIRVTPNSNLTLKVQES